MSGSEKIKVGSRGSALALAQVREIEGLLKEKNTDARFEVSIYKTQGDKDKSTPLTAGPADDFFTDTIDQALLNKKIDISIHSAKDLPRCLKEGLSIFALTEALDETDAFVGKTEFNKLRPGARVATSSLLRQESIKELNPALHVQDIRGDIGERLKQLDDGLFDGVIVATAALKRLGLEKRITDIMPWESTPLQGQLAVVGRRGEKKLEEMFSCIDIRRRYGQVYLVGAGPGDPELVTLKAVGILNQADVVFYDYLINTRLLDHAVKAEKIYVGKRKGDHTMPQSELSRQIRQHAIKGKCVVRLKGGDPLIFGRGADEIEYLRSFHIPVTVIPGVSSATAIPSILGIPLTARDISSSVAFVSGHSASDSRSESSDKEDISIPDVDTVVFLMGLTKLGHILRALKRKAWPSETPIVVVSKGTYPDQKTVLGTLSDIEHKVNEARLQAPAIIIVGQTVNFLR